MPEGRFPRLRGVVLVATSACNQRCAYCLQDRHPPRRMSAETADRALDLLLRPRGRAAGIAFYGGEPLLAFDLVRHTVEEAERRRPRKGRLLLGLSTNGLLLDPGKAAFLAAHGVDTQVSFDGCRAAQELRAPGTFDAVAGRLAELRRAAPAFYEERLEAAVTVTPANLHLLSQSVDWLLERDVPRIALGPLIGPPAPWGRARERELDEQLLFAFRRSLALYRRTGRVPVTLFRRPLGPSPANGGGAVCGVSLGRSITVDVDGEVSGCPLLARSGQTLAAPGLRRFVRPLRIGRLDAPDLGARLARFRAEVRRSPLFTGRERRYTTRRRCAACRWRASCSVCPVAVAHTGEDPHRVPDFLCAFSRLTAKYRERFPPQWAA